MALDRKDVRAKLDPDVYAELEILLDVDGITQSDFIERIITPVIRKRVHDAKVIAARATLTGEAGRRHARPGERAMTGSFICSPIQGTYLRAAYFPASARQPKVGDHRHIAWSNDRRADFQGGA